MKYKLLAFDLDDTLLNREHKISRRNVDTLRRAAAAGLTITIATGRMFRSTLPYAEQLGINVPLITYHGALIRKAAGGPDIWHRPVPLETAIEVADYAVDRGLHLNLFIDDVFCIPEINEYTRAYQTLSSVKFNLIGNPAEYLRREKTPPTKMNIVSFQGMDRLMAETAAEFQGRVMVTQARPEFMEITHTEATKGIALRYLAETAGISREEVAAIGDSLNDISMLEYAGTGVAVANAREVVKQVAQVVTLSNLEDGVAHFVENYVLTGSS
jgi:Cof subfamily protein (haloacid dehalogenase superfamily)